jgi:valine--pyruvate aminotransferase
MRFSAFGKKFAASSGISALMDDLGEALADNPSLIFMGGGNPGRVAGAASFFAQRMEALLRDDERRHQLLGVYQPPQGDRAFRRELAAYLLQRFAWPVTEEHVAIANGSQSAFFVLYNLFAGPMGDGGARRIHLPLSPEYIGYADIGLGEDFFSATQPAIERIGTHRFRYHVDLSALELDERVGALCLSRPTNPSGNVIADGELEALAGLARERALPLIIDGAYGQPFPDLIYREAAPYWDDNTILMLSLSKLGLPGVRTGVVVARPEIAAAFGRANTVISLASGSVGPQLLRGSLADGSLPALCENTLHPYYAERRAVALEAIDAAAGDLPLRVHCADGAFFLWLWCEDLPIDSRELYRRLKASGVIVLPGNDFFIGTDPGWSHRHECIRLSYAGEVDTIRRGLAVIMREIAAAYGV